MLKTESINMNVDLQGRTDNDRLIYLMEDEVNVWDIFSQTTTTVTKSAEQRVATVREYQVSTFFSHFSCEVVRPLVYIIHVTHQLLSHNILMS